MPLVATAGLVMVLFGLGAYYATDKLSAFSIGNLLLGLALLVAAAFGLWWRTPGFRGVFPRRVASRSVAILVGVAAAVVLANAAVSDWPAMIDLTPQRLYTLSPQTLEVLRQIDESQDAPPKILVFEDAPLVEEAQPLVRAYRAACPRLEVAELPLAEAPPEARPHAVYEPAALVCRAQRCEPVGYVTEENLTTALIRVLAARELRAYFLLGHGEIDLADESDEGYSLLGKVLRSEGFAPRGWVGPGHTSMPEDADVLVIGAPERDLLAPELEQLDAYLTGGGSLLVLLEPGTRTNLEDLLERWGFDLPPGVIIDPRHTPLLRDPRPVSLVVNSFSPDHPISRHLSARTMMLVPTVRAVFAARKPEPDDHLREVAYASPYGWLETDIQAALHDRPVSPEPEEIGGREIPLAAAGRYPRGQAEARIVVVGDRDFPSNRLLNALYNRDLLLNALHWLVEQDSRITLRPKAWTPRQDPLTLQETLTFFYFFAFALPEILLLLGIHAWARQRR